MITSKDALGGFTIIVDDMVCEPRPQEEIDAMLLEIRDVLTSHGFDISFVASNEDAMRVQGRVWLKSMLDKFDTGVE